MSKSRLDLAYKDVSTDDTGEYYVFFDADSESSSLSVNKVDEKGKKEKR